MKTDREERPDIVFTVLALSMLFATIGALGYVAWMWWSLKP